MTNDFELWAEDNQGKSIKLGESSNRQYGAILGEAVWHMQAAHEEPAQTGFKRLWLRDMADPRNPRIMDRWPAYWEDYDAWQVNVSKDQGGEQGIELALHILLRQLPSGYPPSTFGRNEYKYSLTIGSTLIFHGKPANEAIELTRRYVAERERNPDLPVGVIDGLYD